MVAQALNSRGFSVIVPVYNEQRRLQETVPPMLHAVRSAMESGLEAELVYICNGCRDRSLSMLAEFLDATPFRLVELAQASKTAALNTGDAMVHHFPRFYVDADVIVPSNMFIELVAALACQGDVAGTGCELVSPVIEFDDRQATRLARRITRIWKLLPHGSRDAFHHVLGLSQQGRSRWKTFPDIRGDDAFMMAQIPAEKRKIASHVAITTWSPSTFWTWVRIRERWERGQCELAAMGIPCPRTAGQQPALIRLLLSPRHHLSALCYLACRTLAVGLASTPGPPQRSWYSDR
jgi:glycosyltransferase involved in cell wall biosynthesis